MPEMVHGKRNFHSDGVAHGSDILLEHGDAFVGDFHPQQRMRQLICFPLIDVRGIGDRSGSAGDHLDTQIHFEPG